MIKPVKFPVKKIIYTLFFVRTRVTIQQTRLRVNEILAFLYKIHLRNPCKKSWSFFLPSADETDKRILATGFDCRQKLLCDANALCTRDPLNENRYICTCNKGFRGNGSFCRGKGKIEVVFLFKGLHTVYATSCFTGLTLTSEIDHCRNKINHPTMNYPNFGDFRIHKGKR